MEFDRTESNFVERKIEQQDRDLEPARVIEVREHTATGDTSNFEVDIILQNEKFSDKQRREVPIMTGQHGDIRVPEVGDLVLVGFIESRSENPVIVGHLYDIETRAPLGKSGMRRRVIQSDTSPAGDGDLKITDYTEYDGNPANSDIAGMSVNESIVQIGKYTEDPDVLQDVPMKMQMRDSPQNDEAEIVLSGNQVDQDTDKSLEASLDFKDGEAIINGVNDTTSTEMEFEIDVKDDVVRIHGTSQGGKDIQLRLDFSTNEAKLSGVGSSEMGISLDFDNDSFTLVDGSGYGIESDGSGNFVWHHSTIDMSEGTTTSL